ncbi:MAG TPA: DUF6600 domain-containing protein, partial [Usitatibacter sp.]|nr:DUF6600 domain-containing protein [Usitatibacter sp.]
MRFVAALLLATASLLAIGASAQEVPGRVGRVSFIEGPVAIYQDPDTGWEQAYVNSPLTSENSLWTEPGSRAEVRVSATALRLDEATQLDVARLDDDSLRASLVRGSLAIRVRHDDFGERLEIDTPEARFIIRKEGRYRVDVDPDLGETRFVVFNGDARMETANGRVRIDEGRMVRISYGDYAFERPSGGDFDRWVQARDARWVEGPSVRYVSTFVTGYEELDHYGQWIQEPGYGALWVPTHVGTDWVPYRYGHWAYVRPWGWTWIDDQPWGYAPFHYGRWVQVRDRWCWYPGERIARPAWAPALVAWVGGSSWNVGVSSSGPVMGWYPLAPNERYRPWYQANQAYVTRVNNIASSGAVERARHDRRPDEFNRTQAVTAVPREQLIARRPVQQSMVRVAADAARNAQAVQPQAVMPTGNELQRMRAARAQTAPPNMVSAAPQRNPAARGPSAQDGVARAPAAAPSMPGAAPSTPGAAPSMPGASPGAQRPAPAPQTAARQPVGPLARPSFARPQAAPAPAPVAAMPAAQPPAPGVPASPAPGNPLARGNAERDRGEQQRQQQEAARRATETQQRAQQQQEQQRGQQQELQRAQEAAARNQQEVQRRAAEAQQQRTQQQAQQQEAQRRAAEAQQQAAQQQQQEAQRRAAAEA